MDPSSGKLWSQSLGERERGIYLKTYERNNIGSKTVPCEEKLSHSITSRAPRSRNKTSLSFYLPRRFTLREHLFPSGSSSTAFETYALDANVYLVSILVVIKWWHPHSFFLFLCFALSILKLLSLFRINIWYEILKKYSQSFQFGDKVNSVLGFQRNPHFIVSL